MTDPTPKQKGSKPPPAGLKAPRFHNDPVLTRCLAGTHRMFRGQTGAAVKLVQQALIDLGFDLGPLADDGVFGKTTGDAVAAYKTSRNIFPNDPVVGPKTMAALDAEMLDKPPAPLHDRNEWLSWGRRGKLPRAGAYNFTRYDEFQRRNAGNPFRLDPISSWMPTPFAATFLDHLSAMLEPAGSPEGPGTAPATWGVSPVDLHHCHVSLGVPAGSAPMALRDRADLLRKRLEGLRIGAGRVSQAPEYNDAWSAWHAELLSGVGVEWALAEAAALIEDLYAAIEVGPALLLWHSFERKGWRPHDRQGVEMPDQDPRRFWLSSFAPVVRRPWRAPFVTPEGENAAVHLLFGIYFLVDKKGLVTALPGSFVEVASVTGITNDFLP